MNVARRFFSWKAWPPQAWGALSAAALLAMEVTVLSLWYHVFFNATRAAPGLISLVIAAVLMGSYLLAYLLQRWQRALRLALPVRQGALLLWLLLAAFGSLRLLLYARLAISLPELLASPARFILTAGADSAGFFHVMAVGLLIWHGITLARGPLSLASTHVTFQVGLVWMLMYGMAFAPSRPVEATLGLYAFLFFGLMAMSAARVGGLTDLRGGRLPRFGTLWLAGIALAALAVVGLSIGLGWLAGTQVVGFVVRAVLYVITALTGLVLMIFTPLIYFLAGLVIRLLELILEILDRISRLQLPSFAQGLAEDIAEVVQSLIPVILAARGLTLALVMGALVVLILLALRYRRREQRLVEEDDTSPSHAEPSGSLLRRLLNRLAEGGRWIRLRSPGQLLAAARIRQIYRQLMALSGKLGAPRPASITPLEFAPRLERLFPEQHVELEQITSAYVRVRYGEYPETMAELEAIQAAWEQVRKAGRAVIAQKRKG